MRREGARLFGEGVEVDDPFAVVKPLKRGNGAAGKTEFAVVIVLDDVPVRPLSGPGKQGRFSWSWA